MIPAPSLTCAARKICNRNRPYFCSIAHFPAVIGRRSPTLRGVAPMSAAICGIEEDPGYRLTHPGYD